MSENVKAEGARLTVKTTLKLLSLLCIVFVFCPTFLVSCSGEDIGISVMTAVGGMSLYGEQIVEPYPIMLICLVLPVAILTLLFVKELSDKKITIIALICSAVDLIVWFIFRFFVKYVAENSYCTFKSTIWFVLNIIALILILLLSVMIIMKKLQMNSDLIASFTGEKTQNALSQVSNAVTKAAGDMANNLGNRVSKENTIGFCMKCGKPITYGCKFCTSCGTPVPESMLAEAEAARKEAEEAVRREEEARIAEAAAAEARMKEEEKRKEMESQTVTKNQEEHIQPDDNITPTFCRKCGAKLGPDSIFCESCGAKVE